MSRTFSLHDWERNLTRRTEATANAAIDRAAALAFRALPALYVVKLPAEWIGAHLRRTR